MTNLTAAFAAYLLNKAEQITVQQRKQASSCILDYLAVAEAGAKKNHTRWEPFLIHAPQGEVPLLGLDWKTDGKMGNALP